MIFTVHFIYFFILSIHFYFFFILCILPAVYPSKLEVTFTHGGYILQDHLRPQTHEMKPKQTNDTLFYLCICLEEDFELLKEIFSTKINSCQGGVGLKFFMDAKGVKLCNACYNILELSVSFHLCITVLCVLYFFNDVLVNIIY